MFPNAARVDGEGNVVVTAADLRPRIGYFHPMPYVVLTTADQHIPTSLNDARDDNAPPAPGGDECPEVFVEVGIPAGYDAGDSQRFLEVRAVAQ